MALTNVIADMQMLMSSSKANSMIARRAHNTILRKYGDLDKFAKAYGTETKQHPDAVKGHITSAFQKYDGGGAVDTMGPGDEDSPDAWGSSVNPDGTTTPQWTNPQGSLAGNEKKPFDWSKIGSALKAADDAKKPAGVTWLPKAHYAGTNDYSMADGGTVHDGEDQDPTNLNVATKPPKMDWPTFGLNYAAALLASKSPHGGVAMGEGLQAANKGRETQINQALQRQQVGQQGALNASRVQDYRAQAAQRFMQAQQTVSGLAQYVAMLEGDPMTSPQELQAARQQYADQSRLLDQLRPQMMGGALQGPPGGAPASAPTGAPAGVAPGTQSGPPTAMVGAPSGGIGAPPAGALGPPGGASGPSSTAGPPSGAPPGPAGIAPPPPSSGALTAPQAPAGPAPAPAAPPMAAAVSSGAPQPLSDQQWHHLVTIVRGGSMGPPAAQAQASLVAKAIDESSKNGVFVNPLDGRSYLRPGFGEAQAAAARPLEMQKAGIERQTFAANAGVTLGNEKAITTFKNSFETTGIPTPVLGSDGTVQGTTTTNIGKNDIPKYREAALAEYQKNVGAGMAPAQAKLQAEAAASAPFSVGSKTELNPLGEKAGMLSVPPGQAAGPGASPVPPGAASVPAPTGPKPMGVLPPPPQQPAQSLMQQEENQKSSVKAYNEFANETKGDPQMVSLLLAQKQALDLIRQPGALTSQKADILAKLQALGFNGAPLMQVLTGSSPTVSAVETALKANLKESTETFGETKGRAVKLMDQFAKSNPGPDMQPDSNWTILGTAYGEINHDQKMMHDWGIAQNQGWSDWNTFRRTYEQANPIAGDIKQAMQKMGPVGGMPVHNKTQAAGYVIRNNIPYYIWPEGNAKDANGNPAKFHYGDRLGNKVTPPNG